MLMVVQHLICHKVVGALWCIISGKGEAERHSRHRGKRQESLVLWSKGVAETILKESWWSPQGIAVEWSRRHEAVLVVLYLPLQFHPPVLKPGLDLNNKKKGVGGGGDNSGTLLRKNVQSIKSCILAAFAILPHLNWQSWTDDFALLNRGQSTWGMQRGRVSVFSDFNHCESLWPHISFARSRQIAVHQGQAVYLIKKERNLDSSLLESVP